MTTVREATAADLPELASALARAFADDPVMTWVFGDSPTRLRRSEAWFEMEGRRHLADDRVLTVDGCLGAAYWAPPDKWKVPTGYIARRGPRMARLIGRRLPTALRGLTRIEKLHPREPHWYLAALGTDPPAQGKGIGAALVAPVIEECDAQGLGAYLESSKEQNVPYYRRFGFEVLQELQLPKGPPVWLMWRDPAPMSQRDPRS